MQDSPDLRPYKRATKNGFQVFKTKFVSPSQALIGVHAYNDLVRIFSGNIVSNDQYIDQLDTYKENSNNVEPLYEFLRERYQDSPSRLHVNIAMNFLLVDNVRIAGEISKPAVPSFEMVFRPEDSILKAEMLYENIRSHWDEYEEPDLLRYCVMYRDNVDSVTSLYVFLRGEYIDSMRFDIRERLLLAIQCTLDMEVTEEYILENITSDKSDGGKAAAHAAIVRIMTTATSRTLTDKEVDGLLTYAQIYREAAVSKEAMYTFLRDQQIRVVQNREKREPEFVYAYLDVSNRVINWIFERQGEGLPPVDRARVMSRASHIPSNVPSNAGSRVLALLTLQSR